MNGVTVIGHFNLTIMMGLPSSRKMKRSVRVYPVECYLEIFKFSAVFTLRSSSSNLTGCCGPLISSSLMMMWVYSALDYWVMGGLFSFFSF